MLNKQQLFSTPATWIQAGWLFTAEFWHYLHAAEFAESFLPRDARSAKRGTAIVSRPSVCLSVTYGIVGVYAELVRK